MTLKLQPGDALLIVDIQNDFLPGGSLGVHEGDQVIPLINADIKEALDANIPIIASRDWHPANHISFIPQGGHWPPHCVQNTAGAAFNEALNLPESAIVINKAFKADAESYSAWSGETESGKGLPDLLKELCVTRLIISGLALDYCVKATSIDAATHGMTVLVQLQSTRAISTDKGQAAIEAMRAAGVHFID